MDKTKVGLLGTSVTVKMYNFFLETAKVARKDVDDQNLLGY